jgi:hypothetical protein
MNNILFIIIINEQDIIRISSIFDNGLSMQYSQRILLPHVSKMRWSCRYSPGVCKSGSFSRSWMEFINLNEFAH